MAKVTIKGKKQLQEKSLNKIGRAIQIRAMNLAPFDTGQLSASIKFIVEGNIVRVYTSGVPYADSMEYGEPPVKNMSQKEKMDIMAWARAGRSGRPRFNRGGQLGVVKKIQTEGIGVGMNQTTHDAELPETEAVLHPFITRSGRYRPFLRTAVHQLKSEYHLCVLEASRE